MKRILLSMLAVASLLFVSAPQVSAQDMSDKNLVEIAAGNENFTTLVAAVKAAGLVETLAGDGPFTVFAPTDEAFNNLPDGLVAALVKPENKATLQKILTYHVVPAKLMASDVVSGISSNNGMLSATTAAGGKFSVMQDMGKVKIKDAQGNVATVTATDIAGSNGVIHVIDRVILPAGVDPAALLKAPMMAEAHSKASHSMSSEPMGPSIAAVASGNDNFKTLVTALGAANLVETFDSPGEYTVFAPTDDAFGKLPEGTVNTLATQQKEQLKGILAYHVVPAKITAAKLLKAIEGANNYYMMQTLSGETLVATVKDGNVQLIDGNGNRSTIVLTDVEASNGIIHAIDTVIMPRQ
ncbi:MAG: fasciclin domain-containing protein [Bacteroidota bacterium]